MSMIVLGVLVSYLAVLVGIGLWSRRRSTDVAGYYVAEKKLPSWVIAISTTSAFC